mmetsp:Transcript_28888/g.44414  ORF Transcript_28888/g.44414 Transcript_28888/m.44414 type:complete len:343 (-) Transcript_28888:157-1185(-)
MNTTRTWVIQHRQGHERIETDDDTPTSGTAESNVASTAVETIVEDNPAIVRTEIINGEDEEESDEMTQQQMRETRRTRRLTELEEEREMSRRRTGICVLIAIFILFRLWVQALMDGDAGLLILCLVGTSWTARWIRHNREREAEIDRRISEYMNSASGEDDDEDGMRAELSLMSFQAQLALAIMESQRQMMQGGFGHPDGTPNGERGVSDDARAKWDTFEFTKTTDEKANGGIQETLKEVSKRLKGGYGSVASLDQVQDRDEDEENLEAMNPAYPESCSICLCDYEDGDQLVRLPCGHLYHEECVSAWTSNHVRCPLCNYDLEQAVATTSEISDAVPVESIV